MREVVKKFYLLKHYNDTNYQKLNYPRNVKYAKQILNLGELTFVLSIMEKADKFFKEKKWTDWNLATIVKYWEDIVKYDNKPKRIYY